MKTIAILYICTGRYSIFWEGFYLSAEKYLLPRGDYKKHYFVFTDDVNLKFRDDERVKVIQQDHLDWPYITLRRYSIFQKARALLEQTDYIYFFNANMLFVDEVGEEFLPTDNQPLVMLKHPGFFDKPRSEFSYESYRKKSLAYIAKNEGSVYVQGSLNGGKSADFLALIDELAKRVDADINNKIIALWHDESHLNRYVVDHAAKVKLLDPTYGFAEDWDLPFVPKILIREKAKIASYAFLRKIDVPAKKPVSSPAT